ncbi:MAG: TraB/GumN family protein [Saprospiraceae bacterium]
MLWQVTPANQQGPPSYLFGTMHLLHESVMDWVFLATQTIEQCQAFATEFDFEEVDQLKLTEALSSSLPGPLSEQVSRQAWKNMQRYCKKHMGISAEVFQFQHPMLVQSALSQLYRGHISGKAIDQILWEHAKINNIPCYGVESFDFQIEVIQKISYKAHIRNLNHFLKHFYAYHRKVTKLITWYAQGELNKLYQAVKGDVGGSRRILAYDRNQQMAERFEELAKGQSLFCAVGAGHLPGEKGMLRILKHRGFKLRPVGPDEFYKLEIPGHVD